MPKGFQGANVTETEHGTYIQLRQAKVARTVTIEAVPNVHHRMYNIDYDTWGGLVGVEIL
jgi:hypothetical protein